MVLIQDASPTPASASSSTYTSRASPSTTSVTTSDKPEILIREFRDEDLVDVVKLFSDGMMYYAVEGHPQYCVWVNYIRDVLKADLADVRAHYMARGGNFWVATTADEATGKPVTVGILGIYKKPDGVGELRRMSVKLEYRRFGIGVLLINHMEQWAKANGFTMLTLSNGNMMTGVHKFYYRLGYKYTFTSMLSPDPLYEVFNFEKHI